MQPYICKILPKRGNRYEPFLFFWGGVISWIAEESVKRGIEKLYFFTREGEFFKKLYDEWRECSPYKGKMPPAQVLEVSRMSVFLPSMPNISVSACMRMWIQYSEQSMEAFCKTLSVDIRLFEDLFCEYGIRRQEVIKKPWTDVRIRNLFQDREFCKRLKQQRDVKRCLLYAYLEQKGFSQTDMGKIGVVDIGWRGSIQDSLCLLYPHSTITGFYIGLQPFLVKQPDNAIKCGYIDSYRKMSLC